MRRLLSSAVRSVLQHRDALRFLQNRRDLVGEFGALHAGGPGQPIALAAPLAQQKASIWRMGIKKCLSGNKSGSDVGAMHCFASELVVSGNHAVGDTALDEYVNHDKDDLLFENYLKSLGTIQYFSLANFLSGNRW